MSGPVQTYQEAEQRLYNRINYERLSATAYSHQDFKLARMEHLLTALGNPQQKLPAIHIAGTKGKGSTAVMIAHLLMAGGYRTGLFTSPHVSRFDERLQVNRESPAEAEFVALVNNLFSVVEDIEAATPELAPTFFELTTALGWLFFAQRQCDVVVLEVGLGGRLDSTNLCHPLVTVITSISYDHTQLLGNTLGEIAGEKAGILKPAVPVVSGVQEKEPREVIESRAAELQAPYWLLGREFSCRPTEDAAGNSFAVNTPRHCFDGLRVPLPGEHQRCNAALAVMAVELLREQGIEIPDQKIKEGLADVHWPIRIERVRTEPLTIIDAAHNEASVVALVNTLSELYPEKRKLLIFGCTRDKDLQGMLQVVLPAFDDIILTEYQTNPRAVPLDDLTELAASLTGKQLQSAATPEAAWELALRQVGKSDLICITGSFFLAAELRDLLLSQPSPTHPV